MLKKLNAIKSLAFTLWNGEYNTMSGLFYITRDFYVFMSFTSAHSIWMQKNLVCFHPDCIAPIRILTTITTKLHCVETSQTHTCGPWHSSGKPFIGWTAVLLLHPQLMSEAGSFRIFALILREDRTRHPLFLKFCFTATRCIWILACLIP